MVEQQLTTLSWTEFAWCAFLYKMINAGDEAYQKLTKGKVDVKELIKFLNKWKTRVVNSKDSAKALARKIEISRDDLSSLRQFNIRNVDLVTVGGPSSPVLHAIENCYGAIREPPEYNIGPTATAKILHILHPDLFVMWDNPILSYFKKQYPGKVKDSGRGYCEYLRLMQQVAAHVTQGFEREEIHPGKTLDTYLSDRLEYNPAKTMAKYLDEYYWVTQTHFKKIELPPKWYPEKKAV